MDNFIKNDKGWFVCNKEQKMPKEFARDLTNTGIVWLHEEVDDVNGDYFVCINCGHVIVIPMD